MLKGKTALITGCAKGIGASILELFASQGADIFACFFSDQDEALSRCQNLSAKYGVNIVPFFFDITDKKAIREMFQTIQSLKKTVDILVNNAGILGDSLIGMIMPEVIEKVFSVNTFATIQMMQYASKFMIRNKSGTIINISSIMGVSGAEGQVVYSGSKAAVNGITKSAAKELAKYNIRVNAIAPGFIDTDMTKELSKEHYKRRVESICMRRAGLPEDVGNCALFLASDMSKYITGQVIGVDGGMVI